MSNLQKSSKRTQQGKIKPMTQKNLQKFLMTLLPEPENSNRRRKGENDLKSPKILSSDWVVPIDTGRASACSCAGFGEIGASPIQVAKDEQKLRNKDHIKFNQLSSIAKHAKRLGNLTGSLNLYQEMKNLHQDTNQGLLTRGFCHFSLGDLEVALKDIDSALTMVPVLPEALFLKAQTHYFLGEFETALLYYERTKQRKPHFIGVNEMCSKVKSEIIQDIEYLKLLLVDNCGGKTKK